MDARDLVGAAVSVEVPATIANLGAGYDCLGLAVDLFLEVDVEITRSGLELGVDGEGAGALPVDRSNRVVVALEVGLHELGFGDAAAVGWRIGMRNPIPLERGLGSSAAATVAGLAAAWALAERPADDRAMIGLATRIEGHPDNVAPALLGGLVASLALDDGVEAVRLEPPPGVAVVAWIPERRLPTAEMRRVLPDSIPRLDAVANLARVAVGVAGLATRRTDVLALLTQDGLHEPYRAAVYPELPILVAAARDAGAIGACLAGAGSTIVAFVDSGDQQAVERVGVAFREAADRLGQRGRLLVTAPVATGVRIARP